MESAVRRIQIGELSRAAQMFVFAESVSGIRSARSASRGIWSGKYQRSTTFQNLQLSDKVDVAMHAMANDEKRSAFAPTLWVREKDAAPVAGQIIEQVWFSGVHSDTGGSYADSGLSDIALDLMIKHVTANTKLTFDDSYIVEYVSPKGNTPRRWPARTPRPNASTEIAERICHSPKLEGAAKRLNQISSDNAPRVAVDLTPGTQSDGEH